MLSIGCNAIAGFSVNNNPAENDTKNTPTKRAINSNTILPPTDTPRPSPTSTSTSNPTPYPIITNTAGTALSITWGEYPPPTVWPSVQIPSPIETINIPKDQINIILLGNDYVPGYGTRTDTVMLLSLNPSDGTASLISFPRDLYVYAPGWTMFKLNTVQPRGGYDLLKETFEYNFGVRPDFYVNISRSVFSEVIDSIGGIEFQVPSALSDPYFAKGAYSVRPGWTHMDGATAKWYVTSRTTSDDFSRNERQQLVLEAIFLRLLGLEGLEHAPELYGIYIEQVKSDIKLSDLIALIPLATELVDTRRVFKFTINKDQVTETTAPISGAFILLPDNEKIYTLMYEALTR